MQIKYFLLCLGVRAERCGLRADSGWQKGVRAAGWRAAGPARIHLYSRGTCHTWMISPLFWKMNISECQLLNFFRIQFHMKNAMFCLDSPDIRYLTYAKTWIKIAGNSIQLNLSKIKQKCAATSTFLVTGSQKKSVFENINVTKIQRKFIGALYQYTYNGERERFKTRTIK